MILGRTTTAGRVCLRSANVREIANHTNTVPDSPGSRTATGSSDYVKWSDLDLPRNCALYEYEGTEEGVARRGQDSYKCVTEVCNRV